MPNNLSKYLNYEGFSLQLGQIDKITGTCVTSLLGVKLQNSGREDWVSHNTVLAQQWPGDGKV